MPHPNLSLLLLGFAVFMMENLSILIANENSLANFTNTSSKQLLPPSSNSEYLGLYQIPPEGKTFLYIAYGLICALALVGNVVVLWLILGSKRMWIVNNIFLVNLAVADIVISLFTIPFHFQAALLQRWELPEFLCPVCPFVQAVTVLVSVLTLSAIAVNRYKVIINPFKEKSSKRTAVFTILLIWAASVSISIPVYMDFSVIHYRNNVSYCDATWLSTEKRFYYSQLLVLCQYFIPLIILTWAYARMGLSIWKSETPGNEQLERDALIRRRKLKVTKMMARIVILFGVCWFPYQLYNILQPYYPWINDYRYINVIWFAFHWLAMSNSCCNPFVYAIYNTNFRNEFQRRTSLCDRYISTWACNRGRALERVQGVHFV